MGYGFMLSQILDASSIKQPTSTVDSLQNSVVEDVQPRPFDHCRSGPSPVMMATPKSKNHTKGSEKIKRRTPRACDRCRLKKSKCDGTAICKTCQASDSACMYTAKREREAQSYYYQLREVTDEALQRLYWACRSRSGFPGDVLDESNGTPSTTAIIDALGLMRPSLEDLGGVENVPRYGSVHDRSLARQLQHTTSSPSATPPNQDECLPSRTQSSLSTASMRSPQLGPTLTASTTTISNNKSTVPATPPAMDMSEQFFYAASAHSSSRSKFTSEGPMYMHMYNSSCITFDLDTYLDTSSCTMPPNVPQPVHNMQYPTLYDISAMMERPGAVGHSHRSSLPAIPLIDRYLTPWPGSLAATYNRETGDRNVSMPI